MITVFAVQQNADLTEGRGPMVNRALFIDEADAHEFSETLDGAMGSRSGIKVVPLQVYHRLSECPEFSRKHLRKKALAKLTPEEIEVLGIK
jgi:hypothetical protein